MCTLTAALQRITVASLIAGCLALSQSCRAAEIPWTATWSTAPHAGEAPLQNQTVRMIVRSTIGGGMVRIRLSNAYGQAPLKIESAHVALTESGSAIQAGSDRTLTFSGQDFITIPPGAYALSDPAQLTLPPCTNLSISIFLPAPPSEATMHANGLSTTYISPAGDYTATPAFSPASTSLSYYWLTDVYVATDKPAQALIAFGDSITDGAEATPNTNSSWPSVLGKLMQSNSKTANTAVLNEGIGGNRILRDGFGASALARFDRDVLNQPHARTAILLEGINDIGYPFVAGGAFKEQTVTAAELIQAMSQIVARCHMHHVQIVGATITPYLGAGYASPSGEEIRETVNRWIRSAGAFDAVVDFDKATEDPASPGHLLPAYDSGDHLHPNDAGYKTMAEAAYKVVSRLNP